MKNYNEKQLEENYQKFIGLLKKYFTGERLEKLHRKTIGRKLRKVSKLGS